MIISQAYKWNFHTNWINLKNVGLIFFKFTPRMHHHHQSSSLPVEHKALTNFFQPSRSWASQLTSFQVFPTAFISSSMVLRQVPSGLPLPVPSPDVIGGGLSIVLATHHVKEHCWGNTPRMQSLLMFFNISRPRPILLLLLLFCCFVSFFMLCFVFCSSTVLRYYYGILQNAEIS